ncbi:hypothetical protein AA313_de0205179 [Arthrobotrys entomopaga]|nr:hypothetical protein AA313_de0205179 [Arthrobotrys entomopaga]
MNQMNTEIKVAVVGLDLSKTATRKPIDNNDGHGNGGNGKKCSKCRGDLNDDGVCEACNN